MTDQTTDDKATLYHASVKDFRATLVKASAMYERMSTEYQKPLMEAAEKAREAGDPSLRDEVPDVVRDAHMGALGAYSYSYVLAAILKDAENEFGKDVAHRLACRADDMLANGDDDNLNGDIELEAQDV